MSGREVEGYTLGECLGSGGTATVFRARRGGEEVALKILHPHLGRDEVVRARFVREAAVARRLSHPGIVRVYDILSWEGTLALVMELCDGGSLLGWRASGAEEIVRVATEVAGALAAAHAQGVVHRDLKPQNLLRSAGRVKICDFGSAGVQDSVGLTTSSILVGTPQYVAPEVFSGHPPDPRTDLYALGAILYEAAAGRPARRGALPSSRGGEVVDRGPLETLPPWLADLILSLLGPIDRRPPDAPGLLRALRRGELAPSIALKRCLFCGAAIPISAPVCLHCGEEELALHAPAQGEGWYVRLGKVSEEASVLQGLAELLRALSGNPGFELDLMIGDVRMYSKEERKRKTRLPARVVEGLTRSDAERLARVISGKKVRASAHRTVAGRRRRQGPLVQLRAGAVLLPEASDLLLRGAAAVPALPDPWMRSLASRLLFAVYDLEGRASAHELREVLRPSCLELRRLAERAVEELASSAELTRGVDRAALYAEVSRAGLEAADEQSEPRKQRALEALERHDAASSSQTRLLSRLLHLSDLIEELARSLEVRAPEGDAVRAALAELEAEIGGSPTASALP